MPADPTGRHRKLGGERSTRPGLAARLGWTGLAAGGVGAVAGAGGLEAFGIQSGTSNPLLRWPAGIAGARADGWINWAGNRRTDHPEGHCYPTSVEELAAIVKTAAQQGKRVRPVGSSWSFSDIAVTPGYVVETNRLTQVLTTVLPRAQAATITSIVAPPVGGPPTPFHLLHVEAGIQLESLMGILDMTNLAPGTMGGAAGQTLAGVVSTSVHGRHHRLPPFPDWVRAIHLVGPDGRQYWIEPQDRPITDPTKLAAALGPDVKISYDDDWFDSVLVGVGSLGIIYSVVLEVRDAYKLEETRSLTTWSVLRPQLSSSRKGKADLFKSPDAVQVAIDPGSMASPDPICFLSTRRAVPMSTPSTPQSTSFDPLAAFCEGDGLLELLFSSAQGAGIAGPVIGAIMVALPAIPAVAVVLPASAPLLPVLAAATTFAAAAPILLQILRLAGPGAVGDLLGLVLDKHPELTAPLIRELTASAQSPGVGVDLAHQVVARRNKGECAARGLALELAFDTAKDAHLRFLDAAITMLSAEAAKGNYLGGWFSLRFVGRSRAILSPERSGRTCTVEFVGLRTLSNTKILLDRLEVLGRGFGGTQHWGMFDDLTAADVARGYPRLDTWRRTRSALTKSGTVRTFDNDFTARAGLSELPANPSWTSLGGGFRSGPAAASWARNRLDVFGRGTDNALYVDSWTGTAWTGWSQVAPNPVGSDPAAVSWGPNRIDVFARATDDQMYTLSRA